MSAVIRTSQKWLGWCSHVRSSSGRASSKPRPAIGSVIAAKTTQKGSTSPALDRAFADIPAAYDRDGRGSHDGRLRHHRGVPERTLTQRELNRALLARQLLLE